MRIIPLLLAAAAASRAEAPFGTWKVNPASSIAIISDRAPKAMTLRFEPHPKGEVFTVETIESDGRAVTSSSILYLDDKPRESANPGCSGTQSSRRRKDRSIEILCQCTTGEWIRIIRRLPSQPDRLVLEITGQRANGRFDRRLVLERP